MTDHVTIRAAIDELNSRSISDTYGIDYYYHPRTEMHTISLRNLDTVVKTTVDDRAYALVQFYAEGRSAGVAEEDIRRREEERLRAESAPEPSFLDRILRRNV